MRYIGLALVCFCSSLLGSAVTIVSVEHQAAPSSTDREVELPETLVAREIVLTDAAGKVRARLRADGADDGLNPGQLVFYDDLGMARWRAGIDATTGSFLALENTPLPNPDHKQIVLSAASQHATISIGHGTLEEIVLRSGPPNEAPTNAITVRGRNSSEASVFTDAFGHAAVEVRAPGNTTLFRAPEPRSILP